MSRLELGKRPKTFKHRIKIPLPEGGQGTVELIFNYRTRTEFGTFLDGILADAKMAAPTDNPTDIGVALAEAMIRTNDQNADYIMQAACGWDLAPDFTRDNIAQMCDEYPGAAIEIINVYRTACTEGRLGN